jgi:hypothetical protein
MKFEVHGPFDLPKMKGLVDNSAKSKRAFWDAVAKVSPGVPDACGCYVYAVKAKRGTSPWYVGITTKRTFRDESLGAHQLGHYNPAIAQKVGVTPQLFFLAKNTPEGRFAKPSLNRHRDVEFLEKFMFGIALNRNSSLSNSKNTKFLKGMVVPGVLNSPQRKPKACEKAFKRVLGL